MRTVKYTSPTSYSSIFTLAEWQKYVDNGGFIPEDGVGYYMNNNLVSDVQVFSNDAPRWATGVEWFNK